VQAVWLERGLMGKRNALHRFGCGGAKDGDASGTAMHSRRSPKDACGEGFRDDGSRQMQKTEIRCAGI